MGRSKDREDSIGIPGRKMCRIEARRRGLLHRTEPPRDECCGSPPRTRHHEELPCWKQPRSRKRHHQERECCKEECLSDEPEECAKCLDAVPNPCGYSFTKPPKGVCPLGEDPWSLGILPDFEGREDTCPQIEAMRGRPKPKTSCCGPKVDEYLCHDCPQIPPPPPPPPPRACCDRTPDDTPVYQSLCINNPGRTPFPIPSVCKAKDKKMKFLKKMRERSLKPSCTPDCPEAEGADAFSIYRQKYASEDAPYGVRMDSAEGYRPIRESALEARRKTMSDWVKIADNRPALNAKRRYPDL